jgi:type IV secretion system protein TrbC
MFPALLSLQNERVPPEGNRSEGKPMHPESNKSLIPTHRHPARRWLGPLILIACSSAFGQATGASPWENAVNALKTSFTGPIATGLSLVAIVVGGLMFAYGEGQSKRVLAGIVFGVGMAIGAVNFMSWLFP